MIKIILSTVIILMSFSMAQATEEKSQANDLKFLFQEADIIENAQIDKGEFDIFHFRSFHLLDADKDGVLLKDECTGDCFLNRVWPVRGSTGERKDKTIAETIRKYEFKSKPYRFEAIDIDASGQLSLKEYISFGRERFQYFDKNRDDEISEAEFCDGYNTTMACDLRDDQFEFGHTSNSEN